MASRANWRGYLKLSLVSCAVALFPAVASNQRVRFNILSRRTGHRVRNQMVDSVTGDPVPDEDRVKGYHVTGDTYVMVEDEELDLVALESTHTLDIERFVPRAEIDPIWFDAPYYLVPGAAVGQEAFSVIREAMAAHDSVAIARLVFYRRERIVTIEPRGQGMLVRTLHYRPELRAEATFFGAVEAVQLAPDMLDLAAHIVASKAGHFDPGMLVDRYDRALTALIRAKQSGRPPPTPPQPPRGNVVSLMEALRPSVAAGRGGTGPAATKPRPTRRPAAGRKRMKKAS